MLIANFLVAQKLVLNCQAKAMLRSHPQPVEQGLSSLQSLFEKLFKASPDSDSSTIGFDSTSAGSLHASLVQLKELFPSNTAVYEACMTILTHPMKPAVSLISLPYCFFHHDINTHTVHYRCMWLLVQSQVKSGDIMHSTYPTTPTLLPLFVAILILWFIASYMRLFVMSVALQHRW